MTHYFYNSTPINPIFFRQFGLSIKQEGAIGQFGTGLKNAIAIILRGGGRIRATSKEHTYEFGVRTETINEREIEIVTMNDEDLSFTLNLGKNWKPWMAFRELLCNAWDEGGDYATERPSAATVFEVEWEEFDAIRLEDYFLFGNEQFTTIAKEDELLMIEERPGRAFYKGVLVMRNTEWPVGFILKGEGWMDRLTEERQLSTEYYLSACIPIAIRNNSDDRVLELWERFDSTPLVRHMGMPPEHLMPRFAHLYEAGRVRSDYARAAIANWERNKPPVTREPTTMEMAYIRKALDVLERAGLECRWNILIREHAHNRTMATTSGDTIYLNDKTFARGLKEIIKCLVEEITHLEYGTQDETYAHQHALLDQWVRAVSKLTGEII